MNFTSRTLHLAITKSLLPVSTITQSWQDPEFVAAHEVYGRDIRVSPGNDRTVDVPFISGELETVNRTIRQLLACGMLCGIFAGLALSQQTQQNTVEGVVLRSGTNEPMPGVSVQLQPAGRSEAYEVQTGNDGRFQFRNIPNW